MISDEHYKTRDNVTPLRDSLNELAFEEFCELRLACHTYKIINIFPHKYIYFPVLSETKNRNTKPEQQPICN